MERFFRYSLERERPIRLMLLQDGRLRQLTARVTALTPETVSLCSPKGKNPRTVRREDILAAAYLKKDEDP